MAAPVVLALLAVDLRRAGPSFRRADHDHLPLRTSLEALVARLAPDALDLGDGLVHHRGQLLLYLLRRLPPKSTLFPYTTLFRSLSKYNVDDVALGVCKTGAEEAGVTEVRTSLSEKKFELWREIKV